MEEVLIMVIQAIGALFETDLGVKIILKGSPWVLKCPFLWHELSFVERWLWLGLVEVAFGCGIGGGTVFFHPNVILAYASCRVAMFFASPLLCGVAAWVLGYTFAGCNRDLGRVAFWTVFFLMCGVSLARFGYCHRSPISTDHLLSTYLRLR